MKQIYNLIVGALVMLLCMNLANCSDDNDSDKNAKSTALVGTWKCSYEDGYDLWIFKADGTGVFSEVATHGGSDTWTITYQYDTSSQTLITREDDDPDDINIFNVISIDADMLIIKDEYEDVWIFNKVN